MENNIKQKTPFIHITKKQNISSTKKWEIRIIAILISMLLCALISTMMGGNFAKFFPTLFKSCFGSSTKIIDLLEKTAIMLLIALSLAPAFKMKFWNIGAEGQVIIGILMCAILQKYLGPSMNLSNGFIRFLFFIILFIACMLAGALWAAIPAIFKAKFNTNETLFTLMMNYIALLLTKIVIMAWDPTQGYIPKFSSLTYFPRIAGKDGIINIIIVVVIAILMFIYLRFTKHGYEISVVGESRNTAIYAGISVKKVIIRTLIVSGAICGICGCLLMAGERNNLTTEIVSGRGFIGVMIAWIGGLNPFEMVLYSFLAAFIGKGGKAINYTAKFSNILIGLTFFVLVACEFFITYDLHCEKIENSKFGKFVSSTKQKFKNLFTKKKQLSGGEK